MAQITEAFARQIIADFERGMRTSLTSWEQCQLAWVWLKNHGHEVPERLNGPKFGSSALKTMPGAKP